MRRYRTAALVTLIFAATALFGQSFVTRRWDDAAIPDAVSFAAGNKLMGLNGSTVTRFSRSVFDALYVLKTRAINTTAPLSGGGDLSADRTLTVATATTSAVGVVELATDGESAAGLAVQANDSRLGVDLGYDPDVPPSSCASCEEWPGNVATLFDEWFNQDLAEVAVEMDGMTITGDSTGTEARGRAEDTPSSGNTDFTVTAKVTFDEGPGGSDTATGCAIGLLSGGTLGVPTEVTYLYITSNVYAYQTDTNFDHSSGTTNIWASLPDQGNWYGNSACLQLRYIDSSRVVNARVSKDCRLFTRPDVETVTLSADPSKVLAVVRDAGVCHFEWIRSRTDDDKNFASD
jgi:hypothetical protein